MDFNTITPPNKWEVVLHDTLDTYFGTQEEVLDFSGNKKAIKGKINLEVPQVDNKIIVNAEIDSFDNFVKEIQERGKDINYHFSSLDIERLYNLLAFQELQKQEKEDAKYNPSRSWSQLKMALNVWFETRF
jgi:hypothetical protein